MYFIFKRNNIAYIFNSLYNRLLLRYSSITTVTLNVHLRYSLGIRANYIFYIIEAIFIRILSVSLNNMKGERKLRDISYSSPKAAPRWGCLIPETSVSSRQNQVQLAKLSSVGK